jgi:hypothetical protein
MLHVHFTTDRDLKLEKILTEEEIFISLSNIASIVAASTGAVRWAGREMEIDVTYPHLLH